VHDAEGEALERGVVEDAWHGDLLWNPQTRANVLKKFFLGATQFRNKKNSYFW
jgi:hypothetical protein